MVVAPSARTRIPEQSSISPYIAQAAASPNRCSPCPGCTTPCTARALCSALQCASMLRRAAQRIAEAGAGLEASTSGRALPLGAARWFSAAAADASTGGSADAHGQPQRMGLLAPLPPPPPPARPAACRLLQTALLHCPSARPTAEPLTLVAEMRGSAGSIACNKLRKV